MKKLLLLLLIPGMTFALPIVKPTCEVKMEIVELRGEQDSKCIWKDRYSDSFECINGVGAGRDVLVKFQKVEISENSHQYASGSCSEDYLIGDTKKIYIATKDFPRLKPGMILEGSISYGVLKDYTVKRSFGYYLYGLRDWILSFWPFLVLGFLVGGSVVWWRQRSKKDLL